MRGVFEEMSFKSLKRVLWLGQRRTSRQETLKGYGHKRRDLLPRDDGATSPHLWDENGSPHLLPSIDKIRPPLIDDHG